MDSKLINGDSLEVLKDYAENSIDLLCTDPPYGYGFMGKDWDQTLPPREIFEECLRVLKPGAFSFVMSAPRSDVQSRMVQMLEEVGFAVSFTPIYWAYATGFPKAMNIGKAVDKRLGKEREVIGKKPNPKFDMDMRYPNDDGGWLGREEFDIEGGPASDEAKSLDGSYGGFQPKPAVEVVIVAMKPLEQKGYLDQALDNQKGVTWLDDCRIPFAGMSDSEQYESDRKGFIERSSIEEGSVYAEEYGGTYNYGFKKPKKSDTYERVSAFGDTEQSETKDGRNLWGKKATKKVKITKRQPRTDHNVFKQSGFKSEENDTAEASPLGRFAANLLISDNVLDTGKKTKSSGGRSYQNTNDMYSGGWAHDDLGTNENPGKGDVGDFSRFYSLDEWWKFRMSRLPEEIQRTFPFLIVPKASKSEKNSGLDKFEVKQKDERTDIGKGSFTEKGLQPGKNMHPTVKPIDLMSYLVVLGSRKDDVILDPFAGSGTTGIACVFSERNYILIEREKEYFKIMEARIKKAKNPADLVQHEWF